MPCPRIFRGRRPGRPGFTLIELLTVMAIIAILIALSATAIFRFIGAQEKSNTATALNKLAPLVKSAWTRVAEEADKEPLTLIQANATVQSLGGGDTHRQRVIWRYLRVQQAFPLTFNEVFNPPGGSLPGLPSYQAYLSNLGINAGNAASMDGVYSNGACLLMALQRRESGGGVTADDLGKASTNNFRLPNGSEVQALVDAWGTPLAFLRWPTSFQALNPGGPQPTILNDPLDPQGYLEVQSWMKTGAYSTFQSLFHPLPSSTGQSYKIQLVLVSAGPDQQFGIDNYGNVTNGGQASDNMDSVTTQP